MAKGPRKSSRLAYTAREQIELIFNHLQGSEYDGKPFQLKEWAKAHPSEFYRIVASLVPKQLQHEGGLELRVVTGVPESEDISDIA